jgi:vacuolar-type H+-ATPase catalytic subunit A/Vma1
MNAKKIKWKFDIFWNTEHPNLEKSNRIDIQLITIDSLKDDTKTIEIECKIISSDKTPDNINKYIDSKKTFPKTNWIMSFITWKYAEHMWFAWMIGFIKKWKIIEKVEKIKEKLKKSSDITTIKNLDNYEIEKSFNYSYISKHSREKKLWNIDIYHLFFDFTN